LTFIVSVTVPQKITGQHTSI